QPLRERLLHDRPERKFEFILESYQACIEISERRDQAAEAVARLRPSNNVETANARRKRAAVNLHYTIFDFDQTIRQKRERGMKSRCRDDQVIGRRRAIYKSHRLFVDVIDRGSRLDAT